MEYFLPPVLCRVQYQISFQLCLSFPLTHNSFKSPTMFSSQLPAWWVCLSRADRIRPVSVKSDFRSYLLKTSAGGQDAMRAVKLESEQIKKELNGSILGREGLQRHVSKHKVKYYDTVTENVWDNTFQVESRVSLWFQYSEPMFSH